jgi:hypothetical protein
MPFAIALLSFEITPAVAEGRLFMIRAAPPANIKTNTTTNNILAPPPAGAGLFCLEEDWYFDDEAGFL